MTPPRERWTFTFELPADVGNGGRFVARLLKHLLRVWGVRCVAMREPSPSASHMLDAGENASQPEDR